MTSRAQNVSRLIFLLTTVCLTIQAAAQTSTPANSGGDDEDIYAIYSLIFTNPSTSHGPDDNLRYLIAATTDSEATDKPCVQPPPDREADFQEVLLDYELRKNSSQLLRPAFAIDKPYALLDANEVKEFMMARENGVSKVGEARADNQFDGVSDVFTLSNVYFNRRHTLALTGLSSWCGNPCGLFRWKVFEKLNSGKWQERDWVNCLTISRRRGASPFRPPA